MGQSVPVVVDGHEFFVEVEEVEGGDGVETVDLDELRSFDGVGGTVEAVAGQLAAVWERVRPTEAQVVFGVKVVAKPGKLTGLLVEGGGEGTLSVTLTWKSSPTAS